MEKNKIWIPSDLILEGEKVKLVPLREIHFEEVFKVSRDPRLWEFSSKNCMEEPVMRQWMTDAVANREKGNEYTFIVILKSQGRIVGSTRFMDLKPEHKGVEIGWTWYLHEFWGSGINEECKYLLLRYCFETLGTIRVEWKAWDRNIRSRAAIQRIGGVFEGIHRKRMINQSGVIRDTAFYSMLDTEWPEKKTSLKNLIMSKYSTSGL